MAEFSMELNDDQKTMQEWVHGFAVNQMRPIAAEWDEREETPWEFIQEAAKIGIYSLDFMMNAFSDKTGLSLMIATEELAWVTPVSRWRSWPRRSASPPSSPTERPSR